MEKETSQEELIREFANFVSPQKVKFYEMLGICFVPGRREGVRVWDWEGKQSWIDCRSAGGVFNLGHCPPALVRTLQQALDEVDMGDHILISARRAQLARRLAELTPGDLQFTTFGASGGEAIDFSIKLARGFTKKPGIIAMIKGYHGHTGLALAATDQYDSRFGPLSPGFKKVPFGNLDAIEAAIGDETAAVILETIPATAGFPMPPDNFYSRLRDLCDQKGILLILDEVQAGLGRTGRLWAFEHWGIVPDIFVLGKGMCSALYPLSCAIYRKKLQAFFDDDPFVHLSTAGGSDLGCAVAMAMLQEVSKEEFLDHVRNMGERFHAGLTKLKEKYSDILKGWNQKGLMIGLIMASQECGPLMTIALAKRGVIAIFASYNRNILQLMPPLIIQPSEVDEVLHSLDGALHEVSETHRS